MYSSSRGGGGGGNGYGQKQQQPSYSSQSSYPNLGTGYPGSSMGGHDGASQLSGGSRHLGLLGGLQEGDRSGYKGHGNSSSGPNYGGQYNSVYDSAGQQIPHMGAKGSIPPALDGRSSFSSSVPGSPKFTSGDYVLPSSRGYGQIGEQLYSDRNTDYTTGDRHAFVDRQSAYIGRDLPSEPTGRYADSATYGHKHQPDLYGRLEMLKAHSLQSSSLDGSSRQSDFITSRGTSFRHTTQDHRQPQDPVPFSGRIDPDPRSLSILSGSSYGGVHNPSILGAGPPRNVDDAVYLQASTNPGYGVSLPPGRDYGGGKVLRNTSLDADYPSPMLVRAAHSRIEDLKDDRIAYQRELERREKEQRHELRERERDREREKERERDRQRERERERERDRERERERDREREREREKLHERERREKERSGGRKTEVDTKRSRTPARLSKERRGASLIKDGRSFHRESSLRESLHRRHSPVKERRREYVCKVSSSRLVDVERDYLSLDKRYPRLAISPECSKVVVNWPKGNLKLSLYTPVSFEHDFVEDDAARKNVSVSKLPIGEPVKLEPEHTVWNSKVILMSGLSQNALEELSSERIYGERVPHFCNMLRFAVLRKDNSFRAIGGQWDASDGGDPSFDDYSLVQTILRCTKEIANLDLQSCTRWNRFLEIHYDRVGKDGRFSHKEITVLYVPDLSDCLPSLDSWRDQWLAHKKAISERETLQTPVKQKSGEKKAGTEDAKRDHTLDKKKDTSSSGQIGEFSKSPVGKDEVKNCEEAEGKLKTETGGDGVQGNQQESAQTVGIKPKKKIVRKIVKQKVAKKKETLETVNEQVDLPDDKDAGEKTVSDITGQQDGSSASVPAMKTFKRKKIVKKLIAKVTPKKNVDDKESTESDLKSEIDGGNAAVVADNAAKRTTKKKIIKKVPKKKAVPLATENAIGDLISNKDECLKDEKETTGDVSEDVNNKGNEANLEDTNNSKIESEGVTSQKHDIKVGKKADQTASTCAPDSGKQKNSLHDDPANTRGRPLLKDEKGREGRDGKANSKGLSDKDLKEKKRADEPPRHPGFILQTTGSKDSKIQSLSLSLDSLLDYSDVDTQESTFEISLFAESLYEMLQYEMGCRLLTFLEKLRVRFVNKRNQRKRQREDDLKKETDNLSSGKRLKADAVPDVKSGMSEGHKKDDPDEGKCILKDENAKPGPSKGVEMQGTDGDDLKEEEEEDTNDDPEEDPEEDREEDTEDAIEADEKEDEEMPDAGRQADLAKEVEAEKMDTGDAKDKDVKYKEAEAPERSPETKGGVVECAEGKVSKVEEKREGKKSVDKELLQAFRFFDRNRVGYIRVEDMRLIIHNLGKFFSHRAVKEMALSALLESNTGRDDRILYEKLVTMSDI